MATGGIIQDASNAGLMEGCFFVPRTELISWLRKDLNLSVSKVEQCASGAIYLQVLDKVLPGKVPVGKINWGLKFEYEFVKNYKVMQDVFTKIGIKKNIEIERLIKGKYQDNLEFLQWLKCFYDRNMGHSIKDYNPLLRRQMGTGVDWTKTPPTGLEWLKPISTVDNIENSPPLPERQSVLPRDSGEPAKTSAVVARTGNQHSAAGGGNRRHLESGKGGAPPTAASQHVSAAVGSDNAALATLHRTVTELKKQLQEAQEAADAAQDESEFYFKKLREIELICTETEDMPTVETQRIITVLYAEDTSPKSTAAKETDCSSAVA